MERAKGDLGRRIAARREELGYSRNDLAARAGSPPGYIQYLEERAAIPDRNFLLRLASALDTSVTELTGDHTEQPPGAGQATHHPQLVELSQEECRSLLGTHGVGRVGMTTEEGPVVLPVNYMVTETGELAYRTAPEAAPAQAAGKHIACEVDRVDEAFSEGWSVLVVGHAHAVTDPGASRDLYAWAHSSPWAGGERTLWVSLVPDRISGRRILSR
jgi:transcriptional regulator with XRE-family HTH domain